jgi:hypothetical protein
MATSSYTPEQVGVLVDAAFGLLERETVLAQLVTMRGLQDFKGRLNDTVTLRVPAYVAANARDLRSNDARVRSALFERKVDVALSKDIQVDIPLTDENLTLDIVDFGRQVIQPGMNAEVRGIEDLVIAEMQGASYTYTEEVTPTDVTDPDSGVYAALVDANADLNNARVPFAGRAAVIGSSLEAQALKDPRLARADQSGSDSALREAQIGRLAGLTIYRAAGLLPEEGYVFHSSAFVLASGAPQVPDGAAWGETRTANGFSIRILQHIDSSGDTDTGGPVNVVYFDIFAGTAVVTDSGAIDGNGQFTPSTDPEESGADDLFVRAVQLTAAS